MSFPCTWRNLDGTACRRLARAPWQRCRAHEYTERFYTMMRPSRALIGEAPKEVSTLWQFIGNGSVGTVMFLAKSWLNGTSGDIVSDPPAALLSGGMALFCAGVTVALCSAYPKHTGFYHLIFSKSVYLYFILGLATLSGVAIFWQHQSLLGILSMWLCVLGLWGERRSGWPSLAMVLLGASLIILGTMSLTLRGWVRGTPMYPAWFFASGALIERIQALVASRGWSRLNPFWSGPIRQHPWIWKRGRIEAAFRIYLCCFALLGQGCFLFLALRGVMQGRIPIIATIVVVLGCYFVALRVARTRTT